MDILITGTTGFVGKNLCGLLADQGHKLIEANRVAITGKQTLEDAVKGKLHAETWIHLAAKSQDVNNPKLLDEYTHVNIDLTKDLFNAFLNDPAASTFIHFSSVKAAAANITGELTELTEAEVDIPYGSTKRQAEKELLAQKLPPGKKLIILRPAMIYGYNTKSNLYSLFKFIKRGLPYPFAAFDNKRTMLSIDNLLFVILHIVNTPSFKGGIYNVADDDSLSTNELTALISTAIGKKPSKLKIPKPLITFMFRIGDVLHLPVNTQKLNKLTANYLVSNSKLKAELGVPLPATAHDSLLQVFNRFQQG